MRGGDTEAGTEMGTERQTPRWGQRPLQLAVCPLACTRSHARTRTHTPGLAQASGDQVGRMQMLVGDAASQ